MARLTLNRRLLLRSRQRRATSQSEVGALFSGVPELSRWPVSRPP